MAGTDSLHHGDGVSVWGQHFTQAQQGAQGGTTKTVRSGTTQTAADQSSLYFLYSHFSLSDARCLVARQGAELSCHANDEENYTDFKQVSLSQIHRQEHGPSDVKLHQSP